MLSARQRLTQANPALKAVKAGSSFPQAVKAPRIHVAGLNVSPSGHPSSAGRRYSSNASSPPSFQYAPIRGPPRRSSTIVEDISELVNQLAASRWLCYCVLILSPVPHSSPPSVWPRHDHQLPLVTGAAFPLSSETMAMRGRHDCYRPVGSWRRLRVGFGVGFRPDDLELTIQRRYSRDPMLETGSRQVAGRAWRAVDDGSQHHPISFYRCPEEWEMAVGFGLINRHRRLGSNSLGAVR